MSKMTHLSALPVRPFDRIAFVVAVVGLGAWACLIVMFVAGEPFGLINDVANGALAVLCAALATTSLRLTHAPAGGLKVATGVAVVGAGVAILGSALIIFDITGYFLAGLCLEQVLH
jgi:hypothetical protein